MTAVQRWHVLATVVGLAMAAAAAAALLTPWLALGKREFSSLDLISTASALDLIEGRRKRWVLLGWMVVPTVLAAALMLAASHRRRLLGAALLTLAPVYGLTFIAFIRADGVRVLWGLQAGLVAASVASLCGAVLLIRSPSDSSPAPR